MKSAVSDRLRELADVASRLADAVDGEDPKHLHPPMVLCRAAIAADGTANKLAGFLEALNSQAGSKPGS